MKSWQLLIVLTVALAALVSGCVTSQQPVAAKYDMAAAQFCSPFLANGQLAPWAQIGIDKGIGLDLHPVGVQPPNVHPYPDNRTWQSTKKPRYRMAFHSCRKQSQLADLAVRNIGSWLFIDETSDVHYPTVEEFALGLYTENRCHPRFAEALAVAMQVYPQLREEYYPATTSGRWFWYCSKP